MYICYMNMNVEAANSDSGKYLCYSELKPKQVEAMASFTQGASGSIVVCMSPLTSLMMNQHAKYTSRGLQAEIIGEAQQTLL